MPNSILPKISQKSKLNPNGPQAQQLQSQSLNSLSSSLGFLTMLYEEALESRYVFARRSALGRDPMLVPQSDAAWTAINREAEDLFARALADGVLEALNPAKVTRPIELSAVDNNVLAFARQTMQDAFRLSPERLAETELRLVAELMQLGRQTQSLL